MKKIEKDFCKFMAKNIKTNLEFKDFKDKIVINDPIKHKKKIPLWAKIAFPSIGSALLIGITVTATVLFVSGNGLKIPNLNLNNYSVNLKNVDSIGIMPLESNNNEDAFVKKEINSDEIKEIDFLKKDTKKIDIVTDKQEKIVTLSNDESIDSIAKKQKDLGWVVNRYFVYEDRFTFLSYVPSKKYYKNVKKIKLNTKGININDEEISDYPFISSEAIFVPIEIEDEIHDDKTLGGFTYNIKDKDLNHYLNNNILISNTAYYASNAYMNSYIIDNDTGLIYFLPKNLTIQFDIKRNELICVENINSASPLFWSFEQNKIFYVDLIIDENNNLNIIDKKLPSAKDDFYFKDKYGQYFGCALVSPYIDKERKINLLDEKRWNNYITTNDQRFLFVEGNKLYEYKDNFEIEEVQDGTAYYKYGYYDKYNFINNDFIYNLTSNNIYDIKNDVNLSINAIAVIGDYYFYVGNDNVLRYIKNPFDYYLKYEGKDYVNALLPGEGTNNDIPPLITSFNGEKFNNHSIILNKFAQDYTQYIYDNSRTLSSDVLKYYLLTDSRVVCKYIYDENNSEIEWISIIPIDSEFVIRKWTPDGEIDYLVTINEYEEMELIELNKYKPKEFNYILTPINKDSN